MSRRLLNVIEGCRRKKTEQTEHEFEHEVPPEIKRDLLATVAGIIMRDRVRCQSRVGSRHPF